ncbi:Uncharacterised protein [Mycobacteroides abscessus subsp. abscessus]|nr:Uncharacterised protein [Mycobacteroides abscessus subsp. abscessus]
MGIDIGDGPLDGARRLSIACGVVIGGRGQRTFVELAVDGEGYCVDRDHRGRNHILRKPLPQ